MLILTIVSVISAISSLSLFIGGCYVAKKVGRMFDGYSQSLSNFFEAQSEDSPSHFGRAVQAVSKVIAFEVAQAVSVGMKGALGGTMKGVNAELKEKAIMENPQLALFEGLPKSVKKNPVLMTVIEGLAGQAFNMGKLSSGNNGVNGSDEYAGRKHRD